MKAVLFICLFFSFAAKAQSPKALFDKAVLKLSKGETKESSALFYEFLKLDPNSLSARFNLALSLYRQSAKPDPARAYLRQILFEKPYNKEVKVFLRKLGDKKYFWLWIPKDIVLILAALALLFILPFRGQRLKEGAGSFYDKTVTNKSLKFFCFLFFVCIESFSVAYFYFRAEPMGTLIKDLPVLSAPVKNAGVLFEGKAGALARLLPVKQKPSGWILVRIPSSGSGWIGSQAFLPLNPALP